ncbi:MULTISPECIES: energy-coupling factor ABC transporter ATP-binding protein [unclassified Microbacterium]|uniref:energy-coupling factor ABC transporter ATP-binding protein n=1 Tax=unclassified Microbacterium TaxID=2609290 RepID=UPI002468A6AE|nr:MULTISPECIES: ABC transporter ATP-binding protein [unclassified Microbacterium]MDH5132281.1 ABC transporter ATP-binding protein [Microbacterium sp. RD10]MDH5135420.1 ABC transporter ATP-binding protein [Microbacterium sp. RD11]MDH5143674.1 ABC transporter ATP-binding protein [Microbacterium sp. RD12]MDH5154198.1 ABC transporter ATP-binding protein [Microbacterium sp. RD06]MDH5164634.1 ABC transporter ATP-binding protein [Microbacterium sp. RD02]
MRRRQPGTTATLAEPGTVRLDGVGVTVDGRVLLDDVTLELTAPRIAVIGENGSGKSTFARLLNGLMTPTTGTVTVHGLDALRERTAVRRRVGFVFTDPDAQILMPTPAEDLALSLRGRPRGDIAARVQETLDRHGLGAHADIPASSLSGGQKQMLALAAVLLSEPALIVADEPTTLLDLRNARRIGDLLLEQDAQVLIVTHDLELAARCDTAVLFDGGRVVEQGDPESVIARYRRLCA